MSFFNTLFKTIKTASDITNVGMDNLNKGLDSLNKSIDEAVNFQKIMSDARTAYHITIELISIADESADRKIVMSKYPSAIFEELDELMGTASEKYPLDSATKALWPTMRRPTTPEKLLQLKADNEYKEYLVTLEQIYKPIWKKCENSPEYEKYMKEVLVDMACPNSILVKLCPNAKKRIFTFTFTMP